MRVEDPLPGHLCRPTAVLPTWLSLGFQRGRRLASNVAIALGPGWPSLCFQVAVALVPIALRPVPMGAPTPMPTTVFASPALTRPLVWSRCAGPQRGPDFDSAARRPAHAQA